VHYVTLLALALFFGFAIEEFFGGERPVMPGGIRTSPLISFAGAGFYLIEPQHALAFVAGLIVLGAWVYKRYDGSLIAAVCALIAYALGPIALTQPLWLAVALVVAAVLLAGSGTALHAFVAKIPREEALTLGQFLLLVGVVLPLLYGAPKIPFTQITPFSVWLAVVAVSALSYASYLLQRYVLPRSGMFVTGALGGLYSSTATTVVLARAACDGVTPEVVAGIIAATAMMYLRMIVIVAVFDAQLAGLIAIPMAVLAVLAAIVAWVYARRGDGESVAPQPANPLRLGTALLFSGLLIAISLISKWVQANAGAHGVLALAAVVGVTDIDPFVLSLAQGGAASIGAATSAVAIVIASSSNNLLKAGYTLAFSRQRSALAPAGILGGLALLGLLAAAIMAR
jgi:uncharacterized membrane protein (DUF4010 family)